MVDMQVFVRSFGCSANTADSEVLSGCLAAAGYTLTESEADADVVVYNSCAVKGPTENRIIDALKRIEPSKKVVVAGCLPLISFERLTREVHFDAAVGPAVGKDIVDVVRRVVNGETVLEFEDALTSMPGLDLPRKQTNPIISVIPINYGCLGSCSYCCVVHARGHLRSYEISEIVDRIKRDIGVGVKEFWITSQDTACYGKDIRTDLPALLKSITEVEGDFKIRLGMMTPSMVVPILDELIEAFHSDKIFKFVHLPIQSGDNDVLSQMRRFYTAENFKDIVGAFRNAFPQITLSTDVICGVPGEAPEAFEKTLSLISAVEPDIVNVSKFFARPKTAAYEMIVQALEKCEIKRRSAEAAKLAKQVALKRNQRWIGWTGEIVVDEKGKVPETCVGRNFAYKPVIVKCDAKSVGTKLHVRVVKAYGTYLLGVVE